MEIAVLYVGSSLLAPLKNAEREINRDFKLDLRVAAHNFGAPLSDAEWQRVRQDVKNADIVFVIHVMDGENATRLIPLLAEYEQRHRAVIVINCMPDLMRRLRMGKLDVARVIGTRTGAADETNGWRPLQLLSTVGSWIGKQARSKRGNGNHNQYLKLIDRLPGILRLVPSSGALRDVKNYLNVFCYFLQPSPNNIKSMLLYSLKHYLADERLSNRSLKIPPPESSPAVAIYHSDATRLFETFADYQKWYQARRKQLDPSSTIGLLLMRPQVVSKTTKHYDVLIRALEAEGLSVIPAISTFMDNRQSCAKFFVDETSGEPRVSQIVSLTGFSFVGGPAMNDSKAAKEFLTNLNRPYRSVVSLDMQTIDSWRDSFVGLNPVQAGMQIAIPEIDGATEPFVYGGIPGRGIEPVALDDRCLRLARRIKRWNRLRTVPRSELKLALVLFCFPPNKGNIGTAADLDVLPSVWDTLKRLQDDGYDVEVPQSADELRERLLGGNSDAFGATANIAHTMTVADYRRCCPYVDEIEGEWGTAPGRINTFGGQLLVQGLKLRNIFIGVQPTFGFEGDPTRLMMARSSTPHHGFMAFYTYLARVLEVDAVVHVGTHGALEFMPGKQLGLSGECWPDRLIGELPNIYLYSVNNPSEGSIAKRRSYAELISYLTPPLENAGLYKGLASMKELLKAYGESSDDEEKARLFEAIDEASRTLNLNPREAGVESLPA
jgi:magnesium chelatase subunit H